MGDVLNRGSKMRPRWYCRYVDVDGRRKQRPTKQPTKVLAEQYLATVEARIARGEIGVPELTAEERARRTVTIGELATRFLAEYAPPRIKSLHNYRVTARTIYTTRIAPTMSRRVAAEVTAHDVERLRDTLLGDGFAPASAVRAMAMLSKLYVWARRVGALDCANPVSGCERPRTTSSLDYLSRIEVTALLTHLEAAAPELHPMVATALYTGMRKGELFGLRWTDVHLDAARIDVVHSYRLAPKSGRGRHLPINSELGRTLATWRERCPVTTEGLVFPTKGGEQRGSWHMGSPQDTLGLDTLLTAAGCHVPVKPWHALRHSFASHFMMSGGNILTLQKLLGHSTVAMTMIYAHLAPDFMAGEIARMSFAARTASPGPMDHPGTKHGTEREARR